MPELDLEILASLTLLVQVRFSELHFRLVGRPTVCFLVRRVTQRLLSPISDEQTTSMVPTGS